MKALLAVFAALSAPSALAVVSCTVSATSVAFGTYNPLSASPLNSNATVTASCTLVSGSSVTDTLTAALSAGSSNSFATRTMLNGAAILNYNLYTSSGFGQVWGDGTGGSATRTTSLTLTPANPTTSHNWTVHGQIVALQDVAPGVYSDTITVSVSY